MRTTNTPGDTPKRIVVTTLFIWSSLMAGTFTGSIFNTPTQNDPTLQSGINAGALYVNGAGTASATDTYVTPYTLASTTAPYVDNTQAASQTAPSGTTTTQTAAQQQAAAQATAQQQQISNTVAGYQDQIGQYNNLLGQAGTSLTNGTNAINRNFDNSGARLQDQLNGQNQNYDRQYGNATKAYESNLNSIDGNGSNAFQSLQSLLGGTGSAGDILAPYAVAQDVGRQTHGAQESAGQNYSNIDQARKDAKRQYDNSYSDLQSQKNSKLSSLIDSIDNQKLSYYRGIDSANQNINMAQGGAYQTPTANNDAIAKLIAEQQGLSSQYADPTYQMQNIAGQAPDQTAYTAKAAQIGGTSNAPQATDPTSAFYDLLRKQQQQQTNQYAV